MNFESQSIELLKIDPQNHCITSIIKNSKLHSKVEIFSLVSTVQFVSLQLPASTEQESHT